MHNNFIPYNFSCVSLFSIVTQSMISPNTVYWSLSIPNGINVDFTILKISSFLPLWGSGGRSPPPPRGGGLVASSPLSFFCLCDQLIMPVIFLDSRYIIFFSPQRDRVFFPRWKVLQALPHNVFWKGVGLSLPDNPLHSVYKISV